MRQIIKCALLEPLKKDNTLDFFGITVSDEDPAKSNAFILHEGRKCDEFQDNKIDHNAIMGMHLMWNLTHYKIKNNCKNKPRREFMNQRHELITLVFKNIRKNEDLDFNQISTQIMIRIMH